MCEAESQKGNNSRRRTATRAIDSRINKQVSTVCRCEVHSLTVKAAVLVSL